MKRISALVFFISFAIGCAEQQEAAAPSAALQQLGVTSFRIQETPNQLSIRALGEAGKQIASLDLTLGHFLMTQDDRGEVDGRSMTIKVLDHKTEHQSEG